MICTFCHYCYIKTKILIVKYRSWWYHAFIIVQNKNSQLYTIFSVNACYWYISYTGQRRGFRQCIHFSQPIRYFNLNLLKCGDNCLKSLKKTILFNDSHHLARRILFRFSNTLVGENPGFLRVWTLKIRFYKK